MEALFMNGNEHILGFLCIIVKGKSDQLTQIQLSYFWFLAYLID